MNQLAGTKRDHQGHSLPLERRQSPSPTSTLIPAQAPSTLFPPPCYPYTQTGEIGEENIDPFISEHTTALPCTSGSHFESPQCSTAASPPCNNPTCDDVVPCPKQTDWCDPLNCLGNICYDDHCPELFEDVDQNRCCDQSCSESARCASPCYSHDCDVPSCSSVCATDNSQGLLCIGGDQYHFPPSGSGEWHVGDPCACIDPRCLENNHLSMPHMHPTPSKPEEYIPTGYTQAKQKSQHALHHHQKFTESNHPGFHTFSKDDPTDPRFSGFQSLIQASSYHPQNFTPFETNGFFGHSPYLPLPSAPPPSATPSLSHTGSISTSSAPTPSLAHLPSPIRSRSSIQPDPNPLTCSWLLGPLHAQHICGERFTSADQLHAHVEKSHIDRPGTKGPHLNCKHHSISSSTSSTPSEDQSSASQPQGFYCGWAGCPRTYHPSSSSSSSAPFTARPKLKRHVQTHTLHKPFPCPHPGCTTRMKTRDALSKHLRTHTGERPYACTFPGCQKFFATSTELKTHTVVHSGQKPHICQICGEGFADSSNLSKHRKVHWSVGMWRCLICNVRMKRWDQIRRHVLTLGHRKDVVEDEATREWYRRTMAAEWREIVERGEANGTPLIEGKKGSIAMVGGVAWTAAASTAVAAGDTNQ